MYNNNLRNGITATRRAFLRGSLALIGGVVSTRALAESVAHIYPPAWIHDAHEVIRRLKTVNFLPLVITLVHRPEEARERIQTMIDLVASQGGGTVRLSAGLWRVRGPIHLRSNIHLQLSKDAVVEFSGNRKDYLPLVKTRWEGTDLYGYSPCIYAADCSNVALTGDGEIRFAGAGDMYRWRSEQTEAQEKLREMGGAGTRLTTRMFGAGSFLRPSFIQFINCSGVLVEGLSIGPNLFWGLHILYSEHVIIRGATFRSYTVNTDGIDIDSSRMVLVEQCIFTTGDDCIAIKSGRDLDGREVSRPSEDIVIRNCTVRRSGSNALAIGSEMSGGVRRVYLLQCAIDVAGGVVTIKSNLDRGGVVEQIYLWDVKAKRCKTGIKITTSYHGYRGGVFPPTFRAISIEGVEIQKAETGIFIEDSQESPLYNCTLKNIEIKSAKNPQVLKASGEIEMQGVIINNTPL